MPKHRTIIHFFLSFLVLFSYAEKVHAQSCNVPNALAAQSFGAYSALVSWNQTDAPVGVLFQVEFAAPGEPLTGTPDSVSIDGFSISLQNLLPATLYRFRVRAECTPGVFSAWSSTSSFRTQLSNPSPCSMALQVGDNSCDSVTNHFPIDVRQAPGNILGQDVELRSVRLVLEHDWLIDLTIWLRAPDGTRIKLVDSIGSSFDNFGNIAAPNCGQFTEFSSFCTNTSISDTAAKPPYIGTFFPIQSLSGFLTGGAANGTWVLEVCDSKANNFGTLRFLDLVFAAYACPPPSLIQVVSTSADGVNLDWDASNSGADSILVEIGPRGFRPGIGRQVLGDTLVYLPISTSFPIQIEGLSIFSELDAYVRYLCAGEVGGNSCGIPFFTACENPTLAEDFNGQSLCGTSCGTPCTINGIWSNATVGDEMDWTTWTGLTPSGGTGPNGGFGGSGNYAYLEASGSCALNKKAILQSQCVDVVALPGSCHFTFAYNMFGSAIGRLSLEISTDGGQTWSLLWTKLGQQGNFWQQANISLASFHGQTAVFRFIGTTTGGAAGDMAVDNLRFFGSTAAGLPNRFYADADGDGFGNPNQSVVFCLETPPTGFVAQAGDCDDSKNTVFPGASEVLCNGIDENCNGSADDSFIGTPAALSDSVCSGGDLELRAIGQAKGTFYWFDAPSGGTPIATGAVLLLENLIQSTTFYLADSIPRTGGSGCTSLRTAVRAMAMPIPDISIPNASISHCLNQVFDFSSINPFDQTATATTYQWTNSVFSPVTNPLYQPNTVGSESFFLTGTSDFGCKDTVAFSLQVLDFPRAEIVQGNQLSLCAATSTTLQGILATPTVGPYQYAWSNGLNFQNIPINAPAGGTSRLFTLSITDQNGCRGTDEILVSTLNSITETAILQVQNVSVCGGNDGSIQLQALNGTGPYRFSWSGPTNGTLSNIQQNAVLLGLTQGAYRITVSDQSGGANCQMILPLIILSAPGLTASLDTILPTSCFGAADGSIHLNVSGIAPTYLWSNNSTNPNLTGVAAGNYAVTVSDGGCVLTLNNLRVEQPDEITIATNQLVPVGCNGENTGKIELFVQGGSTPYTFSWSNGGMTDTLNDLLAGLYTVTVTDATQCVVNEVFEINEPPVLGTTVLFATDSLRCFGDQDGVIEIRGNGGVGEYRYQWSNGSPSNALSGLRAGEFTLTLSDQNGCQTQFFHQIHQPDSLFIEEMVVQQPHCIGVTDGELHPEVTGGVAPYSFLWSNAKATQNIANLSDGSYQVTVRDSKGCFFFSDAYTLVSPQILDVHMDSLRHVGCFNEKTGRLSFEVNGGTLPYTIAWNSPALGGPIADSIFAGNYRATVTDALGCRFETANYSVLQPTMPLQGQFSSVEMPLCSGDSTGSLGASISGGTLPYQYFWNGNIGSTDLGNLPAGAYSLLVRDANQCSLSLQVNLTEPQTLQAPLPRPDTIPCGLPSGKLCIAPQGGISPYSVQWSNGLVGFCQSSLPIGLYGATLTDANGCFISLPEVAVIAADSLFEITESRVSMPACAGNNGGEIALCLPQSQGPYFFSWAAPIGLRQKNIPCDTLKNLPGGRYRVTISDANGCRAFFDTLLTTPPPLGFSIGFVQNPVCFGDETGEICIQASGGTPPYQYVWNQPNLADDPCALALPAGYYGCTLTDAAGCTYSPSDLVYLNTPPALNIALAGVGIVHDTCSNGKGSITTQATGGVPGNNPPYFFAWSHNFAGNAPTNLEAGVYIATVTDHVGCTVQGGPWEVLPDPTPLITDESTAIVHDVPCFGDSTGRIEIFPAGGNPPYRVDWISPNNTGFLLENIPVGLYQAILTDASKCTASYSLLVQSPGTPLEVALSHTPADPGNQNGTAQVDVIGGAPPYSILWDQNANNQTGGVAYNLGTGAYSVVVRDSAGCVQEHWIEVTVPTKEEAAIFISLQILPNPAHEYLTIEATLPQHSAIHWEFRDVLGKLYWSKDTERGQNHRFEQPIAEFPSGLYWLISRTENGNSARRAVVILHQN